MKSRALYVVMVTAVLMSAVDGRWFSRLTPKTTTTTRPTPKPTTTRKPTTTDQPAVNLNGKMFTLSYYDGIYFCPSHFSTTTYPPPTPRPGSGLSVCLRYVTDQQSGYRPAFKINPYSSSSLTFTASSSQSYTLSRYPAFSLTLRTDKLLWPMLSPNIWTSVCFTVDTAKRVVQVFQDSNMSIRKILPTQYTWTGQPDIYVSGFDGQVTDIQMWDHPLTYKDIFYYMASRPDRSYGGNVLTWSNIRFSRGSGLLEDSYELQARQPIGTMGRAVKKLYNALKAPRKL